MADRCGTDRGWWVHRQHGQDPCADCQWAHGAALIEWAAARDRRAEAPTVVDGKAELTAPRMIRITSTRCGTPAGLLAHQWRMEPPCARCTAAWATLGASPITGYHNAGTLDLKATA